MGLKFDGSVDILSGSSLAFANDIKGHKYEKLLYSNQVLFCLEKESGKLFYYGSALDTERTEMEIKIDEKKQFVLDFYVSNNVRKTYDNSNYLLVQTETHVLSIQLTKTDGYRTPDDIKTLLIKPISANKITKIVPIRVFEYKYGFFILYDLDNRGTVLEKKIMYIEGGEENTPEDLKRANSVTDCLCSDDLLCIEYGSKSIHFMKSLHQLKVGIDAKAKLIKYEEQGWSGASYPIHILYTRANEENKLKLYRTREHGGEKEITIEGKIDKNLDITGFDTSYNYVRIYDSEEVYIGEFDGGADPKIVISEIITLDKILKTIENEWQLHILMKDGTVKIFGRHTF